MRNASSDSTDLKGILADKVPKEQERVKNFRKAHGATKVGEVNMDMVSGFSTVDERRENLFDNWKWWRARDDTWRDLENFSLRTLESETVHHRPTYNLV